MRPTMTARRFRRLLGSERPQDRARLAEWENSVPLPTAAKLYAEAADGVEWWAIGIWSFAVQMLYRVVREMVENATEGGGLNRWLIHAIELAIFVFLLFLAVKALQPYIAHQNEGRQAAAQWLLRQEQPQALIAVANCWNPWRREQRFGLSGEEAAAFGRVLSAKTKLMDDEAHRVRLMLGRAFPHGLRKRTDDFTESDADIILVALRGLAARWTLPDKRAVQRIASFPVPADAPNRALIRDMAKLFLSGAGVDPAKIGAAIRSQTPVAVTPTASAPAETLTVGWKLP